MSGRNYGVRMAHFDPREFPDGGYRQRVPVFGPVLIGWVLGIVTALVAGFRL